MDGGTGLDNYHFHREDWDDYKHLRDAFEWDVPEVFNIATAACTRWAEDPRDRMAFVADNGEGSVRKYSFDDLDRYAARLAGLFHQRGVRRGDRVAVNLPQRVEVLITHFAAWKLGAVSVPLSTLFGPNALEYRLRDCKVSVAVVDDQNLGNVREIADEVPTLETVLTVNADASLAEYDLSEVPFWDSVKDASPAASVETAADDPAMIVYTSGTTGKPKGALLPHRTLLGHLPSFVTVLANMEFPEDALYWTEAEWAWIILMHGVIPSLFYGRPILAHERGRFDPEEAFELLERHEVTNYFVPPTALRQMVQIDNAEKRYDLSSVDVVVSGGEPLGANLVDAIMKIFGPDVAIHETYGQTEANALVGDCTALTPFKAEAIGPIAPGHDLRILNPDTLEERPRNKVGEIAVRYEDNPVCFLRYWDDPVQTRGKVRDGWLLTEDLGRLDEDGYLIYEGRRDHVIICSGYRIGPEEIEDILATHEAVAAAGVIGVPNDERGEVPKAFIELYDGYEPSEELATELKDVVKNRLAKYEYPRAIEFVDSLPKTVTGKIQRSKLKEREGLT